MYVLKICCSVWKNENRDKRELSVCKELGMDVAVLAKGENADKGRKDEVDGFVVFRYSTRPLRKVPNSVNRIISLFTWAGFARNQRPDIISGHDICGLTIGWMSNWFRPKNQKAKLVYDSHEFELGRNTKRSSFQFKWVKFWEGFLIKQSAMSIMVNDSIADEVQNIYKLKERPVVVRNIPEKWNIDYAECAKTREYILEYMANDEMEKKIMKAD